MPRNPTITTVRGRRRFVELDKLSWAQIRKLPRDAFTPDEWDSLNDDEKDSVYENDPASQERVAKLVKVFVEPYKWMTDNEDEDYIFDMVGTDGFENFLLENADHLLENAFGSRWRRESIIEEIVEAFKEDGYSEEDIYEALEKALGDHDVYDRSLSDEYSGTFYKDGRTEDQIEVGSDEILEALDGMYPDEIQKAAEEIDRETDAVFAPHSGRGLRRRLSAEDIIEKSKRYGFTANVYVSYWVDWDPDWDRVRAKAAEILEDEYESEEPETEEARATREAREARALEDRKVYVFKDGFYWLELVPGELKAEGEALGGSRAICIGISGPQGYGYPEALKAGKARAFSLRTPAGKSKLALWADVKYSRGVGGEPEIVSISQVKGKANRLPGWDLHKAGESRFKEDEVKKTLEFILNYLEFNAYDVPDLKPAFRYMAQDPKLGPWLDEYDEAVNEKLGIGTVLPRGPVEANMLLAARGRHRDDEPEENPAAVCDHCGGPATGFCKPYQEPDAAIDNPSSTVLQRQRGELTTRLGKRAAKFMDAGDTAAFLDGDATVAMTCKKHAPAIADPDVTAVEIIWGERPRCGLCQKGRR